MTMSAGWRRYVTRLVAAEISAFARYFDRVVQWAPLPHDTGALLEAIDAPSRSVANDSGAVAGDGSKTAVLLSGNLNHDSDIQSTLSNLAAGLSRNSRLIVVLYNPYFGWLYRLANRLGIRKGEPPTTFITYADLRSIAQLSRCDIVRVRPVVYSPFRLLGLGTFVNRVMPALPLLRWLSLAVVVMLRPVKASESKPSLSIVIPARNERGNIRSAIDRLPSMEGVDVEVLFVEGNSTDGTWEEIQQVARDYSGPLRVKALQQTGRGKNDAVRLGFATASGELLTILDADLTMPPELLPRFYDAYVRGLGDFVNGSRLVYPMERGAMRFLNVLGNVFFAKALRHVLDINIGDALCGTKLLSRDDQQRIARWSGDFGDFDPFGDFELLFGASVLGLGVAEIPIAYRERTYGETNISRFTNGWMLLRMSLVGLFRLKLARTR
jgi:hypothetical protein